jgi:hypothetical protein
VEEEQRGAVQLHRVPRQHRPVVVLQHVLRDRVQHGAGGADEERRDVSYFQLGPAQAGEAVCVHPALARAVGEVVDADELPDVELPGHAFLPVEGLAD